MRDYFEICNTMCEFNELFYTLWSIGKPEFTDKIPTAGVCFDKHGNTVKYLFNKQFYDELDTYERTFVISHEIMHVVLNHGSRLKPYSHNSELKNIAMDMAIHEIMFNRFGFDKTQLNHKILKNIATTETIGKQLNIKFPQNSSTEIYYSMLLDKAEKIQISGMSSQCQLDDHDGLESFDGEAIEISEEQYEHIKGTLQDVIQKEGKDAGNDTNSEIRHFNVKTKKKKKWERIVKEWVQKNDQFTMAEQWTYTNPRHALLNKNYFLPSKHRVLNYEKEKINIYLFQDTSGSCVDLAPRFLAVARSIPEDRFNIRFFCFDTMTYEIDYHSDQLQGFGGTRFDIIEQTIQKEVNNGHPYPDGIFVITDGYGTQVLPQKPKLWTWILSSNCKDYIPKESTIHKLEDYE